MRLLGAMRIRDARKRIGVMDARRLACTKRHVENLGRGEAGQAILRLLFELRVIVLADLVEKHVAGDQHGSALVAFLKDRLAPLARKIDEPECDRDGDEDGYEEGRQKAFHRDLPGLDDLGDIRHRGHHRTHDLAARQGDVDALVGVEVDPVPERGINLHADELEAVLVELDRHDHEPGGREEEEPHQDGQFRTREPHQKFVGEKLRAAGKIARIALHPSARAVMGQGDGPAVCADIVFTRHDTAPGACRFPRRCGRGIREIAHG